MKKITALRILNVLLAALVVFQIFSGLEPLLVPYVIHQYVGVAIGVGIVLHLYLNWGWIRINILGWK